MLMVIFGAGASFDAVPSRKPVEHHALSERLPLAPELFADRTKMREITKLSRATFLKVDSGFSDFTLDRRVAELLQ
jgi:hypothetical protein